ncbi:hypothetical protein Xbed_01935 [Xenorhabdus beddingii]|uniref:Inverse autotransporter beta-barrel domain-containing protein n=1 Tax=Xenorhabdus beddingii TaxID=40578 RepID=A0A1Y2SN00_9GAMM|nr:hypothetical protein [Xenorhabdus beddingii]OTA20004.1 hypothetical protein Xbed_01935 [Xenorhabdus beddingii]
MSGKNNKMEISILHNADLIIGQHASFVVKLSSDEKILPLKNIIIKNPSDNISFNVVSAKIVYDSTSKKGSATLSFTVLKKVGNSSIQDGYPIKFEVHTDATTSDGSGFQAVSFAGTAHEINAETLSLFIEKSYLQTPLKDNTKPSENHNFTSIYTTLKSKSGKVLVGTPVFITSGIHNKMEEFDFKDANQNEILLEKLGPNKGIAITSDSHGLVKFYLYPKLSLVSMLELKTVIPDIFDVYAKKTLYVVNYSNPGYMNSIGVPNILGYTIGNLSADGGVPYFLTEVSSYDGALVGDVILFFVNDIYTGYAVPLVDIKAQLDQYSVKLPYSIFKQEEPSNFSYTVVKSSGHSLYSEPLPLTYVGGIPYEPVADVKREFEPCIVHPSIGVGPDNILQPGRGNYINYDAIMRYPGYKHKGLFIEIIRSNDINKNAEINPVPLDITDITLTMYINSDNNSFQKTYTKQMSLAEIGGTGNPDSIFFHIKYDDISGIEGRGYIYFDYQFYQDNLLKYGVAWTSNIETAAGPGETGN